MDDKPQDPRPESLRPAASSPPAAGAEESWENAVEMLPDGDPPPEAEPPPASAAVQGQGPPPLPAETRAPAESAAAEDPPAPPPPAVVVAPPAPAPRSNLGKTIGIAAVCSALAAFGAVRAEAHLRRAPLDTVVKDVTRIEAEQGAARSELDRTRAKLDEQGALLATASDQSKETARRQKATDDRLKALESRQREAEREQRESESRSTRAVAALGAKLDRVDARLSGKVMSLGDALKVLDANGGAPDATAPAPAEKGDHKGTPSPRPSEPARGSDGPQARAGAGPRVL